MRTVFLLVTLSIAATNISAQANDGDHELFYYIAMNQYDGVVEMLAAGANVNARDDNDATPLHVYLGQSGVVLGMDLLRALLNAGANVNARDNDGDTPLHVLVNRPAYIDANLPYLSALLEAGADPNMRNYRGDSAFHHVLRNMGTTGLNVLSVVVEAGADPNLRRRERDGETPLQSIVRSGSPNWAIERIVRMLLEAGANPRAPDDEGNSAVDTAGELGMDELVRIFEDN